MSIKSFSKNQDPVTPNTKKTRADGVSRIRFIVATGMLSAVAFVLQYIEIVIPLVPSFIKFDFADLPGLIGAFAYGPMCGILICLIHNILHLVFSQSMFIGELSNFILGAVFAGTAGLIYKANKTKKTALVGSIAGAAAMAAVSVFSNYFVVYPVYYKVAIPKEAILGMYQAILPSVDNILQCLLVFNLPFTLVKGLVDALICMLIYKPLSPILHGSR